MSLKNILKTTFHFEFFIEKNILFSISLHYKLIFLRAIMMKLFNLILTAIFLFKYLIRLN